jgi:hypothetical protein
MSERTDIHRPSLLDPAEYTFLAAFYQGTSTAMANSYAQDMKEYDRAMDTYGEGAVFDGNFVRKSTCDHCGAAFNHGVLFLHKPTQTMIHVGHICASNTVGLPSKAAAAKKRAEKAAREEAERIKRHEAAQAWADENADVVEFLDGYVNAVASANRRAHPFLDDMVRGLHKWGTLFPRQAEAVRKFIANDAKPKPEPDPEPTTPLAEGNRVIEGKIVSVKDKHTPYGMTLKMLVVQSDFNKVWGTVPRSLEELSFSSVDRDGNVTEGIELKGQRVRFSATVERSRDDEHFGFYKRPTKAQIIS